MADEEKYSTISIKLKSLFQILNELRDLGVMTNKKDFTCQLGEWLVLELYGGVKAKSGNQKDWDIKVGKRRIQVKAHAKAQTTGARFSSFRNADPGIDELVIVVFTSDYKLKEMYRVPWRDAEKLICKEKHKWVIYWNHLKSFKVDFNKLPNQGVISLFS